MIHMDFISPYIIYALYAGVTAFAIGCLLKKAEFFRLHKPFILATALFAMIYTVLFRYVEPMTAGAFLMRRDLPFYVCRGTSLILLVYFLSRLKPLHHILYFLGGTGIFGVLVPAGPIDNIANLREIYFIEHFLLAIFPFYLLVVERYTPSFKQGVYITVGTLVVLFAFIPINEYMSWPYFFMSNANFFKEFWPSMSWEAFLLLKTLGIFIFIVIYYHLGHYILKRTHP